MSAPTTFSAFALADITNRQQASLLLNQSTALNFSLVAILNQAQMKDDQTQALHSIERIFFPQTQDISVSSYDKEMVI